MAQVMQVELLGEELDERIRIHFVTAPSHLEGIRIALSHAFNNLVTLHSITPVEGIEQGLRVQPTAYRYGYWCTVSETNGDDKETWDIPVVLFASYKGEAWLVKEEEAQENA